MGEDVPQISMDPLVFILASLSMTEVEYQLWRNGIPYAARVTDEHDYDEFNDTRLMSFLIPAVCVLPSLIYFDFSFALLHMMIFKWNSYVRLALLLVLLLPFLSTLVGLYLWF